LDAPARRTRITARPALFRRLVVTETEKWAKVVKAAGTKAD